MVLDNRLVSIFLTFGSHIVLVCGSVTLTLLQRNGCRVSIMDHIPNLLTDLPQAP